MPVLQYLGIRAYSFFLKKSHISGNEKAYELNGPMSFTRNLDGQEITYSYSNALDLFIDFVENSSLIDDKEDVKQLFSCEKIERATGETDKFSYYFFAVHSGYYGYASELIDRISLTPVHRKTKDQADVKRFYIMVVIPKDAPRIKTTRGLIFFQEVGVYGVKTITSRAMQSFFTQKLGLTIKTQNLAPDFYLKKIFDDGIIRKIKLGRSCISRDPTDRLYGLGYGKEERVLTPIQVTKEMKASLKHVSEAKYNCFYFEGIEYPEVKMEINIGNRVRTINLHGLEDLSVEEALPDEIMLSDGTIDYSKLKEHMLIVADEYIDHLPNDR